MLSQYPSKTFLQEAKRALGTRSDWEVAVKPGWRERLVKREICNWPTSAGHADAMSKQKLKGMQFCMVFAPALMSMHYFAISHGYEMSAQVSNGEVLVRYKYLG